MALEGKGFYLWQILRTEGGSATAIANAAVQAGLTHVLIKIADGDHAYNLHPTTGADLVPPVLQALRDRNIEVWGWHYVYGYAPNAEADIAISRIQQLGVAGYIIDAEMQYEEPGRDAAARQFMSRLRLALPNFPIALSSFRYPTYHPAFPWQAFLERVDINMPQVYWVGRITLAPSSRAVCVNSKPSRPSARSSPPARPTCKAIGSPPRRRLSSSWTPPET